MINTIEDHLLNSIADTVPLLAFVFALFHLVFLVPLISVVAVTEKGTYACNDKLLVEFALYGILILYILLAINEVMIAIVGLRGGPLEEKRRRLVRPLLYLEVLLWLITLAMTILATVVANLPSVGPSCWSDNPCSYLQSDIVPKYCTMSQSGDVHLTPACATLVANMTYYENKCFNGFFDYAATYAVNNYNASRDPPFNSPSMAKGPFCNDSINVYSDYFYNWLRERDFHVEVTTATVPDLTRFSAEAEGIILNYLGIPYNNGSVGESSPWFQCFGARCQALLMAGDTCASWDVLLNIPDSQDRKQAFLATVYTSWGLLALTGLVVYFAFNSWQHYDKAEAWEGTVRGLSGMFCCAGTLEKAETEEGTSASHELGKLLHVLFGGIDLDPTDQLLGIYLVAERQRWRRRQHALRELRKHGIVISPPHPSLFLRIWHAITFGGFSRFRDWYHKRKDVELVPTMEGSAASMTSSMTETDEDPGSHKGSMSSNGSPPKLMMPSPFDIAVATPADVPSDASPENGDQAAVNSSKVSLIQYRTQTLAQKPPSIAHSFARLVSLRSSARREPSLKPIEEATGDNKARNKKRNKRGMKVTNGLPDKRVAISVKHSPASVLGKALVVDGQSRPLLTPVTLSSLTTRLPITSYEASKLYGLSNNAPVSANELQEALDMSRFAKAAYGLQTVRWKAASDSAGKCAAVLDSCLACCFPLKRPLDLDSHFRKRNFKAILDLTGVSPTDLLYVSYASAAFGVLPYMVLLHRPSKSVVLAVRGTVGFDDLITDLLSNPVDAQQAMPKWVQREAGPGAVLSAHAGILSSMNAVLKDLEENGLINAMLNPQGSSDSTLTAPESQALSMVSDISATTADYEARRAAAESAAVEVIEENEEQSPGMLDSSPEETSAVRRRALARLRTLKDDDTIHLSLQRAQSVMGNAVLTKGWKLTVVGHSLGAAVACMLSFHLRARFPTLRCFAFCPPGGLMSDALSRVARLFCTSLVVGRDAIPRLGLPTTRRVVDDMVLALARCKRPKLAIVVDVLSGRRKDPESTPPTFCAIEDIGPEAREVLEKYLASSLLHSEGVNLDELYPPGRIIHLRSFPRPRHMEHRKDHIDPATRDEVWDAVWVSAKDVIGEGILLSRAMMRHHQVTTLQAALKSAIAGEASKTGSMSATCSTCETIIEDDVGNVPDNNRMSDAV